MGHGKAILSPKVLLAIGVAIACIVSGCSDSDDNTNLGPVIWGDSWYTFANRLCYFHVPDLYNHPAPASVLIFYHGEGEDPTVALSLWRDASDAEGFILCCPNWTGDAADVSAEAADAGAILAHMKTIFSIWANRAYIGGFSTGGQVAFTSALSLDGSWAGAVAWAALLPPGLDPASAPRTDMAVYLATGENDTQVTPADMLNLETTLEGFGFTVHADTVSGGGHDSGIFDAAATWTWISQYTSP